MLQLPAILPNRKIEQPNATKTGNFILGSNLYEGHIHRLEYIPLWLSVVLLVWWPPVFKCQVGRKRYPHMALKHKFLGLPRSSYPAGITCGACALGAGSLRSKRQNNNTCVHAFNQNNPTGQYLKKGRRHRGGSTPMRALSDTRLWSPTEQSLARPGRTGVWRSTRARVCSRATTRGAGPASPRRSIVMHGRAGHSAVPRRVRGSSAEGEDGKFYTG